MRGANLADFDDPDKKVGRQRSEGRERAYDLGSILAGSSYIRQVKTKVVVWFDGACPLCRKEIAVMCGLDRKQAIDFVDIAGDGAIYCPIDRGQLLARFHAQEDGKILSGAAAFAAMWRVIPIFRSLGLLARIPAVLWVLERTYRIFLRHRPSCSGFWRPRSRFRWK